MCCFFRKEPCDLWEDRKSINNILSCEPCSIVALSSAIKDIGIYEKYSLDDIKSQLKPNIDGYVSLKDMDTAIKYFFPKAKKVYFSKSNRQTMVESQKFYGAFSNRKAIVCVFGHYIYMNHDTYYSYFVNDNDKVVAIWFLNN